MIYILLNLGPILAATLAGLVAGALWLKWLAPPLAWSPRLIATAVVAEFWLAAILAGALILAPSEAPKLVMALLTPIVIWAGFVLPALMVTHAVRGLPVRTALVDVGHWLLVTFVQAAVLHALGLVPPPA